MLGVRLVHKASGTSLLIDVCPTLSRMYATVATASAQNFWGSFADFSIDLTKSIRVLFIHSAIPFIWGVFTLNFSCLIPIFLKKCVFFVAVFESVIRLESLHFFSLFTFHSGYLLTQSVTSSLDFMHMTIVFLEKLLMNVIKYLLPLNDLTGIGPQKSEYISSSIY